MESFTNVGSAVFSLMTLLANAAISFPYTKDVVMSPAAAFHALAAAVALRELFLRVAARPWPVTVTAKGWPL